MVKSNSEAINLARGYIEDYNMEINWRDEEDE
jgi:hypothetical protein